MFTDLETLRADVKERLTPLLPEGWKVDSSVEGAVKSLTPVLYVEFVRIDTAFRGEPLGTGQVAASFNLIITDPKTDTTKAEGSVDGHVVQVLAALDSFADMFWDNAEKQRLEDGPLAWKISAGAFVSTATTEE